MVSASAHDSACDQAQCIRHLFRTCKVSKKTRLETCRKFNLKKLEKSLINETTSANELTESLPSNLGELSPEAMQAALEKFVAFTQGRASNAPTDPGAAPQVPVEGNDQEPAAVDPVPEDQEGGVGAAPAQPPVIAPTQPVAQAPSAAPVPARQPVAQPGQSPVIAPAQPAVRAQSVVPARQPVARPAQPPAIAPAHPVARALSAAPVAASPQAARPAQPAVPAPVAALPPVARQDQPPARSPPMFVERHTPSPEPRLVVERRRAPPRAAARQRSQERLPPVPQVVVPDEEKPDRRFLLP